MTKSQLSLYALLICGSISVLWLTSESKEQKEIRETKQEIAHDKARVAAIDASIKVHEDLVRLAEVKGR